MKDAKALGRALSKYTDDYFTQVMLGFVVTYILYPFNQLTIFLELCCLVKFFAHLKNEENGLFAQRGHATSPPQKKLLSSVVKMRSRNEWSLL